jgi:hypothetical protein
MLDVFFLSYDEISADENFQLLQLFAPHAKRVHGIDGILNAHKECAKQSSTGYFYVVDADAIIDEQFSFKFTPSPSIMAYPGIPENKCVYTWRSLNPVNKLIYGYGAVKLFPKRELLNAKEFKVDMTTTIGCPFVPKFQISNVTAFNTTPFDTWKGAFREATKLASSIIPNGDNIDNKYRLEVWCSRGAKAPYGEYSIMGAKQGRDFGNHYKNNKSALHLINDYAWLREQFEEATNE